MTAQEALLWAVTEHPWWAVLGELTYLALATATILCVETKILEWCWRKARRVAR